VRAVIRLRRRNEKMEMGIDIGYGVTKTVRSDGLVKHFRSVVGLGMPDTFGIARDNFRVVRINGEAYTVGEEAEKYRLPLITVRSRNSIESIAYRALLLACIGDDVSRRHAIVTGLPLGYYNSDKSRVAKIFRETLPICEIKVVPQPIGTFYDLLFDDKGDVCHAEFMERKVAVIDIGTYTTDLLVMDKATPVAGVSGCVEMGIDTLTRNIMKNLLPFRRNISSGEIERALKTNTIKKDGQQIDVSDILAENKSAIAANIWSWVQSRLGTEEDIDVLVLTGGGGEILRSYFVQENIIVPKSPFLSNALGFCKIARRLYGKVDVSGQTQALR
jgi:plasmid segregation protein ParM